jgi:hypothetical protein
MNNQRGPATWASAGVAREILLFQVAISSSK